MTRSNFLNWTFVYTKCVVKKTDTRKQQYWCNSFWAESECLHWRLWKQSSSSISKMYSLFLLHINLDQICTTKNDHCYLWWRWAITYQHKFKQGFSLGMVPTIMQSKFTFMNLNSVPYEDNDIKGLLSVTRTWYLMDDL